jgi:HEPN domain-containing protein
MPPERNQPGSPEDWLLYAHSDLELAKISPPSGVLLEALCFHAQQAAEKTLKAILVFYQIPFQKTHSIRMLLDLLSNSLSVPGEIDDSASLTDYAVMGRYPGNIEPIDEKEYRETIALAEAVVSWAEDVIGR